MRFQIQDISGQAMNAPYTYKNTPAGAAWDYRAHAQLAFGLIMQEGETIPDFMKLISPEDGEKLTLSRAEKEQLGACIRRASLRALERESDKLFAQRQQEQGAMMMQAPQFSETQDDKAQKALDYADEIVPRYFRGEQIRNTDGRKMIEQIIESRRRRKKKAAEENFRVN